MMQEYIIIYKFGVLNLIMQIVFTKEIFYKLFMNPELNRNDKYKHFISKLRNNFENVKNVWRQKRKIRPQTGKDMINEFLTTYMGSQDYLFLSQGVYKDAIKNFLNDGYLNQVKYNEQLEKLSKNLIKVDRPKQVVNGSDIVIKISYNTTKMNRKYQWGQFKLKQWIQKFVKMQLKKSIFDIRTQTNTLRILEGKQQSKDNYTGIYLIDPFFNCVKIEMAKVDGQPFKGRFNVESGNINQFQHIEDQINQKWANESDFNLTDPIHKLLAYIFQKQNGSAEDERLVQEYFEKQRMKTINDLTYNTQQILKQIPIKKWKVELSAQLEKLINLNKQKKKNKKVSTEKNDCLKMGNSHKILRYVFYMANNQDGNGLSILDKEIPRLNFELIQKAISIIEKELQIKNLFSQLRSYFKVFCITGKGKMEKGIERLSTPNGILFYGPPGTGKTRLTQDLAQLMGMTPISIGLSSAEFMKELVGQSKGTINSYLRRPLSLPHLICCFSIDEIDAIVGDRRKPDSKSGEATAMLLAGLGGNQNIQNLLVFGSTNYKNNIDSAILRRFTPYFYVGLPSLEDRKCIIKKNLPRLRESYLSFLSKMTPNFSGAALQKVCNNLSVEIHEKGQNAQFEVNQLLRIVETVGTAFNIKFGNATYPHLYQSVNKQISMSLCKSVFNQFMIIEKQQDRENSKTKFKMVFAKQQKQQIQDEMSLFLEIKEFELNLNFNNTGSFANISQWIKQSIKKQDDEVSIIVLGSYQNAYKYYNAYDKPTFLIIKAKGQQLLKNNIFLNKPQLNLYVINYVEDISSRTIFKSSQHKISYKKKLYSGKFIVDLTNDKNSSMLFERVSTNNCPLSLEKISFLQQKGVNSPKEALPQVVECLMSKQVDYIQMIDSQLMTDNNAFDTQTYQNIITSKIDEATQYQSAALIIDMGSLVSIKRDISYSQHGQSLSIGINEPTIYQTLIEQIKKFAQMTQNSKKWIAIMVEDEQLLKKLKRDIKWPDSPQEQQQKFVEEKKKRADEAKREFRKCLKCSQVYTGQQNQKQKTCKQHYGYFINQRNYRMEKELTQDLAKENEILMNLGVKNDSQKVRYRYSCCLGYIDSQPCESFYHWFGHEDQKQFQHPQQLANEIKERSDKSFRLMNQKMISIKYFFKGH